MLTFVTWLWKGWRPLYSARNVNALQRMLKAHYKLPHRLICITDHPDDIECETFPLWAEPQVRTHPRQPNCYVRLNLFRHDIGQILGVDRMVSIDLDTTMFEEITGLFNIGESFKIVTGQNSPYNGSMWYLRAGAHPEVWKDFDPIHSPVKLSTLRWQNRPYIGSDQAWMSYKIPGAPTWGPNNGVYQFFKVKKEHQLPTNLKILFFPGLIKPWAPVVQKDWPKVYETYLSYSHPAMPVSA